MSTTSTHASEPSSASSSSIPAGGRIELEMQTGIQAAQHSQGAEAGAVGDPHRHDERDGLRGSTDGVLQREAVLAQGEVERRALERPAAVVTGAVADRLDREEVGQAQQRGEVVQRAAPAQPRQLARTAEMLDLVDLIPGDVLALPLVAVTGQPDDGRDLGEPARGVARQRHAARTVRSSGASLRRARTSQRRPRSGVALARRDTHLGLAKGHGAYMHVLQVSPPVSFSLWRPGVPCS